MTVFTETDCPADARLAHGLTHAKASNLSEVRIGDDSFRAPLAFLCWQRVTPPAVSRQGILCCDVSHREWRRRAQFGHTDYPQHPLGQVLVLVPDLPKLDVSPRLDVPLTGLQTFSTEDGAQDDAGRSNAVSAGHAVGQHMLALPQGMFHKRPQSLKIAFAVSSRGNMPLPVDHTWEDHATTRQRMLRHRCNLQSHLGEEVFIGLRETAACVAPPDFCRSLEGLPITALGSFAGQLVIALLIGIVGPLLPFCGQSRKRKTLPGPPPAVACP